MKRAERSLRTSETYRILATELQHHFANGSEFLHLNNDGSDSPDEVVRLRFAVLERVIAEMRKRSRRAP